MKSINGQHLITAQELAGRANEPYDTIDHWAGQELLRFSRRGRRRLFDAAESLKRCRKIRAMQNQGHSLTTIKRALNARGSAKAS